VTTVGAKVWFVFMQHDGKRQRLQRRRAVVTKVWPHQAGEPVCVDLEVEFSPEDIAHGYSTAQIHKPQGDRGSASGYWTT
jgi:hypothetical protein